MSYRKKLIEVALPLEAINIASAREKSIRHGHPSTLHLWWARRPLAAARAVIFASLVDDPDDPESPAAYIEACRNLKGGKRAIADPNASPRQRLFDFIEQLVQWESTTDEAVLEQARELIRLCTNGNPPPLLDPFAGGGSIPLEAQRLGLEAHASDLNPVAVMINKAQIEIPPRFANQPPVNPRDRAKSGDWKGAAGLAADVRYYGEWMRERAWERIGHLYPTHNGETVIAWIWARTVKSPNPAVNAHVPLVRSFELSKKKGRNVWIEPQVDAVNQTIHFEVCTGEKSRALEGTVSRRGGRCLISGVPIPLEYIREEGKAGRMGMVLMAIVTEGKNNRQYYSPTLEHSQTNDPADFSWSPDYDLVYNPRHMTPPLYGMTTFTQLFSNRQLSMLNAFSDELSNVSEQIYVDLEKINETIESDFARDYVRAIATYLALSLDRVVMGCNTLSRWNSAGEKVQHCFARQALPIVWDYADPNPFTDSTGSWNSGVKYVADPLEMGGVTGHRIGYVYHQSATEISDFNTSMISTDPPYYDNVPYADLSDFFYVWLRHNLKNYYPTIFSTLLVPKDAELVADRQRFGGREQANQHFEAGMTSVFAAVKGIAHLTYPITVFYAFKDTENTSDSDDEIVTIEASGSTGWETMLEGLIKSGLNIVGTLPMRTEMPTRLRNMGANALASSIVLICRPRPEDAPTISRREFLAILRREVPTALKELQSGNIAPVDLAQASIGPGMGVYSRYKAVLEADGTAMSVRTALGIINQELDAYLAEQDGEIDGDTRFAIAWFEQFGFNEGEFGQADVLARAKNTSVSGVEQAGLVESGRGKVRLRHWSSYDPGAWNPESDQRPTIWEAVHHLIERLNSHGEEGAALLQLKMPPEMAAEARNLSYRLYSICERKGWADHARDYNNLVILWTDIADKAASLRQSDMDNVASTQNRLFE